MIEAWRSGRIVTYKKLPGWNNELPWSLLLVPGWRELDGLPLPQIIAAQWEIATRMLLDDLAAIAPARITVARYDSLLANPTAEIAHLCKALDFAWDRPIDKLPLSRYTLTPPDPNKWRRHESEITAILPGIQATLERAQKFAAFPRAGVFPPRR
jgi:hypothetical protein